MLASVSSFLPPVAWLLISVGFYAGGEFVSKTWANSPSGGEVAAILAFNGLSTLFWLPAIFSENKLAEMGTAWLVLGAAAPICIGVFLFKEQLSGLQWTGIGFAFVAFLLLTQTH
jgi:multidrug transporter EmrE-like cation transporter